jgi:hypothetical protein
MAPFGLAALIACHPASSVDTDAAEGGPTVAASSRAAGSPDAAASSPGAAPTPAPSTASPIPASVQSLHATATGAAYDLKIDDGGISFCDDRSGRRLVAGGAGDVPYDRPCHKGVEGNASCGDLPLDVTVEVPGLGPDDRVTITSGDRMQVFMVRGHVLDCAAHDDVVAAAMGDRVLLLSVATGRTETVEGTAIYVAIGADWVAWIDGSDVRARRRTPADAAAPPATVPVHVAYTTVRADGFRVDVPTFFEESSTPHGGTWTWAWESARLVAHVEAIDPGATPATMCAETVSAVAHVVSSQATKAGCFVTGTSGTSISWLRAQYRCGRRFGIDLDYDETLKTAFDPIVSHISASWQVELDGGALDGGALDGGACP